MAPSHAYALLPTTTQSTSDPPASDDDPEASASAPITTGTRYPPSPIPFKSRSQRRKFLNYVLYAVVGWFAVLGVWHLVGPARGLRDRWASPASSHGQGAVEGAGKYGAAEVMDPDHPAHINMGLPHVPGRMALEDMAEMIGRTDGYYVRDWSLWLGWNNVRFILETALGHAHLLNRTLVLPSFVYMRTCEYSQDACRAYAPQVNRGDAVNSDEWRNLPMDQQQAWVMPISRMVDLDRMRLAGHSVITCEDFGVLVGWDAAAWERGNGLWPTDVQWPAPNPPAAIAEKYPHLLWNLTTHRLPNNQYDPSGVLRTDRPFTPVPPAPTDENELTTVERVRKGLEHVRFALDQGQAVSWEEASAYVMREFGWGNMPEDEVGRWIRWAGVESVYSFGNKDQMTKTVSHPTHYIVSPAHAHPFTDFRAVSERILHLDGEIHSGRPPSGLWFASTEARDEYARMVLFDVNPVREIELLGERIAMRMQERVEGRMWTGGHMRRGDFVRLGWAQAPSIQEHIHRIAQRLRLGIRLLGEIKDSLNPQPPTAPDCPLDTELWQLEIPHEDDPYYLATDDRSSPDAIHSMNALLLGDLLTQEDRRELVGWPLLYTDVLAEVEQEALARAAFFYGSATSSVSGGILNLRAKVGRDPRTGITD